jgi:hypothetical protein
MVLCVPIVVPSRMVIVPSVPILVPSETVVDRSTWVSTEELLAKLDAMRPHAAE